jgi:hypothetical protein
MLALRLSHAAARYGAEVAGTILLPNPERSTTMKNPAPSWSKAP